MTTLEQLQRVQIERLALERAATKLEQKAGNKVYMQAWKNAAKIIRDMKPELTIVSETLNDNPQQISSVSLRPV